jgi:hypothetical protein
MVWAASESWMVSADGSPRRAAAAATRKVIRYAVRLGATWPAMVWVAPTSAMTAVRVEFQRLIRSLIH